MTDRDRQQTSAQQEAREIARKAQRQEEAQHLRKRSPWRGLRMFGLVGWAVAVPTILGIALGAWIDAQADSKMSWTLALLLGGAALGCVNAWYWVQRELNDD